MKYQPANTPQRVTSYYLPLSACGDSQRESYFFQGVVVTLMPVITGDGPAGWVTRKARDIVYVPYHRGKHAFISNGTPPKTLWNVPMIHSVLTGVSSGRSRDDLGQFHRRMHYF